MNISINNNPGIICAQLLVSYDADKLELVSYADGKLLNGWITHSTNELNNNPAMFSWEDSLAPKDNTANGVILTLTFNVKEGATGNAAITVSYDPENFFNYDFDNVEFVPVNGAVNIQEAHVHAYDKVAVVPPTETEQGYTLHECECGESYKDNYTDPVPPAVVDVNNVDGWITVTNNDEANTNWLVSVFYLGENMVDDPVNDWVDLNKYGKMFPEMNGVLGYRMYKTLDKILITKAGNYAVRVKYTDSEGASQLVAKVFTVETVASRVNVVNNKIIITGLPEGISTGITLFYLGDETVKDPLTQWADMVKIGQKYPEINTAEGYRYYSRPEAIYLGNAGNYAIRVKYKVNGEDQFLVAQFAIEKAVPGMTIENNKLFVNGVSVENMTSVAVFYLGEKAVNDPSTDWKDLVLIGQENLVINSSVGYRQYSNAGAVYLGNVGNYAIRVKYKDADGNEILMADQFLIDTVVPGVSISGNKVVAQGFPAGSNPSFSVFYLGDKTVESPAEDSSWSTLVKYGREHEDINGTNGFLSYNDANAIYLGHIGNYVIRARYTDSNGEAKFVAVQSVVTNVLAGISVSENRVFLAGVPYDSSVNLIVFYLGNESVTDPVGQWADLQRIGKNYPTINNPETGYKSYTNQNQIFLNNIGNYAIRLSYYVNGVKTTVATQVTIDSVSTVPYMYVNSSNKLVINNTDAVTLRSYNVIYLGDTVVDDLSNWTKLSKLGKDLQPSVNGSEGYKYYSDKSAIKFKQTGNYVIRISYKDASGAVCYTLIQQKITAK